MSLVSALCEFYSGPLEQQLAPANILVTAGASEGLFAAGQAFLEEGDEVILFEPFFDIYCGSLTFAGAKLVPVQLHLRKPAANADGSEPDLSSSMYQFDVAELTAAFSDKTKMIWINTPHNPTGKMFSREELEVIAELVRKHPKCIVLSDEVYEWITYDDTVHNRFATLPGMWERTVTVSSAAKTFSVTGWKIGWSIGPHNLVNALSRAHEYIVYCVSTPHQESLARVLRAVMKNDYLQQLKLQYKRRRDILVEGFRKAKLNPIVPQGAFYITIDASRINIAPSEGLDTVTGINMDWNDWKIARWFTGTVGVTPIPCSAFYVPEHVKAASILRFAFCKTEELLQQAVLKLANVPHLLEESQSKRKQELSQ